VLTETGVTTWGCFS